jgi:hypothetical protein
MIEPARRPSSARSSARSCRLAGACAAALWLSGAPGAGHATPRPLPFTYPYMTLPRGKLEVEQYLDFIPVRIARELPTGDQEAIWSARALLQTELEYGVTDRLEVAFYFAFRQGAAESPVLRFDGIKQRVRYRFADPGAWPVDVGVYFEAAQMHNEIELEEKVLLSRSFGPLRLNANLWIEQEHYFQDDETKHIYNPTLGASWELSPRFMLGLEYWARGRFDRSRAGASTTAGGTAVETDRAPGTDAPPRTYHYLGPTVLVQSGEVFLSVGAYGRLDLGREIAVGESFGRVWVRALLGVGL